jgi:2-polyprenyl-6-methoxyphenol hydroxylase-like FAD-dependent oxidoreductase
LLAEGIKVRHATIWYRNRALGSLDVTVLRHRFDFILSLPQADTENVLAGVLAEHGVRVTWRTALTGLRQDGHGVLATLARDGGGEEARFDYLFGADGRHSTTRKTLDMPFEGYTRARTWSIADAVISDWPHSHDAAQLFLADGGDIAFVIPIGANRFRAVSNTAHALARLPEGCSVDRVLRSDTFEIPVRQVPEYRRGRVFLGGDAAHVHSPVGARGMNLGIEDAAAFARRFAARTLAGYSAERKPVARRWIKFSERALGVAQATHPLAVAVRNEAFRAFGHSSFLQRRVLERVAGLRE